MQTWTSILNSGTKISFLATASTFNIQEQVFLNSWNEFLQNSTTIKKFLLFEVFCEMLDFAKILGLILTQDDDADLHEKSFNDSHYTHKHLKLMLISISFDKTSFIIVFLLIIASLQRISDSEA